MKLGVSLWLTSVGLTGPLGAIVGFFASILLGSLLDKGILVMDLTISSLKVALSKEEFKDAAKKAYDHATARVYTEEEKVAIRKQYQDIIDRFGSVGNGLREQ